MPKQLELLAPKRFPLVAFLRDPLPERLETRKGVFIVRRMQPFWAPRDAAERELEAFVKQWVEGWKKCHPEVDDDT